MNRTEHLQWAKNRALDILKSGTMIEAYTSFISDMNKHEETREHIMLSGGLQMILSNLFNTKDELKKFINDFN